MTNPEEKPAAYASPPCFMHEVDPAWSGVAPDTEGNRMNDQASPTTLSKRELEQAGMQALLKIPDAAVLCDRKGVITFWNDGAARIFGYSATQALGQSLDIIIPERLRERHWNGYFAMLKTGTSIHQPSELLNVPALTRLRQTISIQFTVAPISDDEGRITGILSIMRDITETRDELRRLRTLENAR